MSMHERRQRALGVYVSRLKQSRFGLSWVGTRSEENRQREQAIAKIEMTIVTHAGQLSDCEWPGSPHEHYSTNGFSGCC